MAVNPITAAESEPLLADTWTEEETPTLLGARRDTSTTLTGDAEAQTGILDETTRLAALQSLPWYKRPSLAWMLPLVLLLGVVMGIGMAPQEQLIIKIVCKEHFKDTDVPVLGSSLTNTSAVIGMSSSQGGSLSDDPCYTPAVQALAALVMGRIRSLKYATAVFTIGYFTSLSDQYGRKALIYLTLFPLIITQVLIVIMARPSSTLAIEILYLDSLLVGVLGGGQLLSPSVNAYIADCTAREGRSLAIGFMMVSLSVGLIVGPVLGGYLIEVTGDVSSAVIIAIGVQCFLILYVIVLPESLPAGVREHLKGTQTDSTDGSVVSGVTKSKGEKESILERMKNGLLTTLDPLLLFLPGRLETSSDVNVPPSQYTLLILVVAYGFLQFSLNGNATIIIPYTNVVFQWTTLEDGIYYSVMGAASFIVYTAIFPGLQKLYKFVYEKESVSQLPDVSIGNSESQSTEEELHSSTSLAKDIATRNKSVWNDLTFFIFGCVLYVGGYLIVPLIETEATLYISLASVCVPAFTSLVTSYVPIHQTGKALGGICVLDTIILTVSALVYGWVFSKTSVTMPSAVFLVSTAFTLFATLAGLFIWNAYRRNDEAKK
ncbi:hypothetical protein BGZ98_007596 [Dissophora globulifera]|nr:hypothetical protein BGZ98_007596 [Dissophora globulifera]